MPETSIPRVTSYVQPNLTADDKRMICAISIVATILANVLHEGVGHGLTTLLTGNGDSHL